MEEKHPQVSFDTHAGLYLNNQTNMTETISFDGHCISGLKETVLGPYEGNIELKIVTDDGISCITSQSKATISSGSDRIAFELGTGKYNTEIKSISNPANFTAFLAVNEYGADTSFDFYVYNGPNILTAYLNSILIANAQAIMSALLAQQVVFGPLQISLSTCTGLDQVSAIYAAVSPQDDAYRFSVILSSQDLDFEGEAALGSVVPLAKAYIKTQNLNILVDGSVTFNGVSIASFVLSTIKFSLDDISIGGPIFDINPILLAIVSAATASNRALEGVVNDEFNQKILGAINKAIKNNL